MKTVCLTEQPVEVSVFARRSDDDCVQPFLGPHLQKFQPGLIHFLWSFQLIQTTSHVTSPEEQEQSERRAEGIYVCVCSVNQHFPYN